MTDSQLRAARENPDLYVAAIIKRKAGLPLEQKEIGVLLGCSRGVVSNIEKRAIRKIRAAAEAAGVFGRGAA